MKKKQSGFMAILSKVLQMIPAPVWLLISFVLAMGLWWVLSVIPVTSRAFPNVFVTIEGLMKMVERGVFWQDLSSSLISVFLGYGLGFIIALPVAILMAWYLPVRNIIEPWIQFIRNIPPLAYVPLVVISAGIGRRPQIIVICLATFLTICVTVFQGVINVDETLIKAARVLGANDTVLFVKVIFPATTPFILVAARLGLSTSMTTLMASEIVGGDKGIGMMIQQANGYYQMDVMLMGIILLGIIPPLVKERFYRWQGALMLAAYAAYVVALVS